MGNDKKMETIEETEEEKRKKAERKAKRKEKKLQKKQERERQKREANKEKKRLIKEHKWYRSTAKGNTKDNNKRPCRSALFIGKPKKLPPPTHR